MPTHWLWVDVFTQRLREMNGAEPRSEYVISTARNGLGEQRDSGCTPRGWHVVRARIGEDLPTTAILRGRRWTGACYSAEWAAGQPRQDWILGRILWLAGSESGFNRGGLQDTFRRYIYIHGTADVDHLGQPASAGCVRMAPDAVCMLFAACPVNTPVFIGLQPPLRSPARRY
ncbi:MAG: L,D-transpeptidase family protein [Acidithiobacillus sp.]